MNTFIKKFLESIHSLREMLIIKRSHFSFGRNWWYW